jgi:hypothetical protein
MKSLLLLTLTTAIVTSGLLACANGPTGTIPPVSASSLVQPKKTMKAFTSEHELVRYLREWAEKQKRAAQRLEQQAANAYG